MTGKIVAILLVPSAGDPHRLLDDGPCGSRPPTAWRYWPTQVERALFKEQIPWQFGPIPRGGCARQGALVLAQKGKSVPEGLDRICRRGGWRDTPRRVMAYLSGDTSATYLVDPMLELETVLIDVDGVEALP